MKRLALLVLALVVALPLAVLAFQFLYQPDDPRPAAAAAEPGQQALRGQYLVRAGNCMTCHTTRGGPAYAGGRAIVTPFGAIYSSNLTPDRETGIGTWSADDFWRALHHGRSKDGSFLYPAFPYPNYTRVTRADADAMHAYLRTIAPVRQQNRAHALRFPFNQRILLGFWRALYFRRGEFQPQAAQDAAWNRGAYLVQGLGHCSACHTGRNALGGTLDGADLAGGMIPMLNWYASSLTADPRTGIGQWQHKDLADLLATGVSLRGAVYGPMAEVVATSLQHLSAADIDAMARYLKSLPATASARASEGMLIAGDPQAILKRGAALYEDHCAACHRKDGSGAPPVYPRLAGARSLTTPSPVNAIRIVLNGGFPPVTAGNPRPYGMPPSGVGLSDDEIAAVVSYARSAWGNRAGLVSPVDVARFRGVPAE